MAEELLSKDGRPLLAAVCPCLRLDNGQPCGERVVAAALVDNMWHLVCESHAEFYRRCGNVVHDAPK